MSVEATKIHDARSFPEATHVLCTSYFRTSGRVGRFRSSDSVSCFPTIGLGSTPRLGKVDAAFHPYCSGSINEYQTAWEPNTGGLASD
ncbi:hypothetical protein TNCV_4249251 [Trichonephila clavipes]|nr:hypothetical protein TNCV_4249251 [Trichonephila clavipes]